jgi:RNA polymerase sigma-70 factor, ECF subfamily
MIGVMAGKLDGEIHVRGDHAGELRNFGSWMASEQKRIFMLCCRLLRDADEADSATQDAFLKAYKALSRSSSDPEGLRSPAKWITRIAVNTCLDRLRSRSWKIWQRRPPEADEELILRMTPGHEPDAERLFFAKQVQQRLDQALGKLSARQRAVFSLRHYDDMPLEDIADVLKLDVGTVKAHLFRALTKMREHLRDLYQARR